jgi:hypothetical protein
VQLKRLLECGEYLPGQGRIEATALLLVDDLTLLFDMHSRLSDVLLGECQILFQERPIHAIRLSDAGRAADDLDQAERKAYRRRAPEEQRSRRPRGCRGILSAQKAL